MRTNLEIGHIDTDPALRVVDVSFGYYPNEPVLQSVSLTVPSASLTCIIGPNGGGKSTFLKVVLGLLPPSQGSITVFGVPPHKVCSRVGYVPQHTAVRPDFPIQVREVVRMGGFGRKPAFTADAISQAIRQVGMEGFETHPFAELSGGQRQRVLIARALVGAPGLLLLDEPASGVDPVFEKQLRELLFDLKKTIAVVVVSHDLTFIGPQIDQILFIDRTAKTVRPDEISGELIGKLYRQPERVS